MKKNMEGFNVSVYTDGGWKANGVVSLDEEDRICILDENEDLLIILKSKICILKINEKLKNVSAPQDVNLSPAYHNPNKNVRRDEESEYFIPTEENGIGHTNQYGSILPSDLLEEDDSGSVDDFAISWGTSNKNRIEVIFDSSEEN